jgi:hypothetical protein
MNFPPKLSPAYRTETVNASVLLHQGVMTLRQDTVSVEGTGTISLEWLPSPHIAVSFVPENSHVRLAIARPVTFDLKGLGTQVEATLTSVPMLLWANPGQPVKARVDRLEFGDMSRCQQLRFHLPNFSFFLGELVSYLPNGSSAERAVMEYGGFRIALNRALPFGDPLEDALANDGGYAITHAGIVERIDGSLFSLGEIKDLLECLGYFLSFCRGCWTHPILLCAEDSQGKVIGEYWEITHIIDRFKQTRSWLPSSQPVPGHLFQVFGGYAATWFSTVWGEPIRLATQWYIESSTGAVEKSIILIQAAFELLAWTRLIQETAVLSVAQWNSKQFRFSAKLLRLIQTCSIPITVPSELSALQAYCSTNGISDGPESLTSLRNALVHPNPTKRARLRQNPDALLEAWVLGLWYMDLIMLQLCAFRGTYSSRLLNGWPGQTVVKVPWA